MKPFTRYFILVYCLFETFVFTGIVLGWSALHNLLVKIQLFRDTCEYANNSSSILTMEQPEQPCSRQDNLLNLAYTIASFSLGATSFVWGFALDRWGLKIVRLLLNVLLLAGTLLLSLTQRSRSYLLFPSLILISLAGVPLRMANLQVASLFPAYRSTIISLYSGAFAASSAVFVFIKYAYDEGLAWEWCCSILVFLTMVMLLVTLFVLPSRNFQDEEELDKETDVAGISPAVLGTYSYLDAAKKEANGKTTFSNGVKLSEVPFPESTTLVPLRVSVFSVSYFMHQYWFCWLIFDSIFFVGTLHLWSKATFDNDSSSSSAEVSKSSGDFYAESYCLLQISGLFLSPVYGAFMDWNTGRAMGEKDPDVLREKLVRSTFWPLALTVLVAAGAQVSSFFFTMAALWSSIVFVTIYRTMMLSIGTAYLQIRFPAEQFNRLVGILSTVAAVFTVLQFPLFMWASASPTESLMQVSVFNTVCLAMACVHPLLILITPLQRRFLRNEIAAASQATATRADT